MSGHDGEEQNRESSLCNSSHRPRLCKTLSRISWPVLTNRTRIQANL